MMRRSLVLQVLALLLILVSTVPIAGLAAEVPPVLQLSDPSYTDTDRATISQALTALEAALGESFPVPRFRLVARGWQDHDFAVFAGGRLEASGFDALVVQGQNAQGTLSTWVLAGVPLGEDRIAWIPVNSTLTGNQSDAIGGVAWESIAGGEFAAFFAAPSSVVAMAPNRLPTATFVAIGGGAPRIHSTSVDSDGSIIAYVWEVNGDQVEVSSSPILNYAFPAPLTYTVSLTVYDNRGGMASTSKSVEVEEESACGCHP